MPHARLIAQILFVCFALCTAPARAGMGALPGEPMSELSSDVTAELAGDLQALLQAQRLAGATVATVHGPGSDVLALGLFNTTTRQPLRAEDRVEVGSIAKSVLALAVLRLVSQGRLGLDTPLAALLPQVQLDNSWAETSPVRLRHLLDMSAGLPDVQLWHVFNPHHGAQQPLALALRAEAGPIRLRSEPGTQFSYSNLSFTLAAMVIEALTGERYEAWAARELLRPLGMTSSSFDFRHQGEDPLLAWGHLENGQPVANVPVAVRPATQFTTTAGDMARLMRFLLGTGHVQGQPGDDPFLRSDLMLALGRSPTTHTARAGLQSGYGLGLFTRDRHGAVGLCHGGSSAGWRAMFCVYRASQRAFFITINTDREDAQYTAFDARLVRHLDLAASLPQARAPAPAPAPEHPAAAPPSADAATRAVAGRMSPSPDSPDTGSPASAASTAYTVGSAETEWNGLYVPAPGRLQALALPDRLFGFWHLKLQPGGATLREGFGPARTLLPAGPRLYRRADRQQASLALLRDADGQPLVSDGYLTRRRASPWAQGAVWASAALGALAMLALLPLAAWRLRGEGLRTVSTRLPAAWALLLLLMTLAAWALQGWQRMGELTPITALVAFSSLLWPLACAAQAVHAAWRWQQDGRRWQDTLDGLIGLAALQSCGLLALHGWLPLLPWRL